jgi:hypothetical protein
MKNYILPILLTAFCLFVADAQVTEEKNVIEEKSVISVLNDAVTKSESRYYYFPNMEVYYDIKNKVYHYQADKTWQVSAELPAYYGGYSLFKNERVYITDYEGDNPEELIKTHRKEFPFNPKGRIKRPNQSMVNDNSTALIE